MAVRAHLGLVARVQNGLVIARVLSLLVFAVVAIVAVVRDGATPEQLTPPLSWFRSAPAAPP